MAVEKGSASFIEKYTIGYIPLSERHGKIRDLFTLWFSVNIAPLPIVTGALSIQIFDLNLLWGIIAIIVGHFAGGAFMALHSAQGPQMGIPQMIQCRAQFGSLGTLLVVVIAIVMYIGFFASNIILAGQSLHGIVTTIPISWGIIIGAIVSGVIGVIGYRLIHVASKIGAWVLGISMVVGLVFITMNIQTIDFFSRGSFNLAGFLASVSLGALWQIAYAPYVSDYSRYLPADISVSKTFWASYLGSTLGSSLSFIFGVVAVLATPTGTDTMDAVSRATGSIGPLLLVLFLLSVVSQNSLNLYGAVLGIITLIQTFVYRWLPTAKSRAVLSTIVLIVCVIAALGTSDDFINNFLNLILVLLIVLVPWTAINLVDFYLIHKGKYDINSIFQEDGGIYGYFNPNAMIAYFVGIIVQIPFMKTPMFVGSIASHMNDIDISWLVGIVVTSPFYYWLAKRDSAYNRRQLSG